MKKLLKITGITIVIILALLILVPIIFQDKLIELAKTEINNQVDAKIDFGEFNLSIFSYFPNLNFEINDVTVRGINKFKDDTLMQIKQLSANVDIMSVLGDKINVHGIHIIEPTIYAHVLPDTSANWDIAKTSTDSVEVEKVKETERESEDATFNLSLREFSIQKANIVYNDESGDILAYIKNLDYTLKGDLSLTTVELEMALLIEKITVKMEGIAYLNKTNIEYNAGINANLEKMRFELLDNKFRMNKLILSLAGYMQMNSDDSYDMNLSFGTNKNQFKDLLSLVPGAYTKDFNEIKTSGALKFSGFAKGTYSEKQLPAFNLKLNVDNASIQYPDLPASINQIFIDLIVDNKDGIDDHTIIDLKRFDINLAENPFSARYIFKTPVSDPYIEGSVKGSIDFDKIKNAIPLDSMSIGGLMKMNIVMKGNLSTIEEEQYDEFEAQGNITLQNFEYKANELDYNVSIESTNLEFSPKDLTLENFDAKVGKSDFQASGRIENFLAYYFKDELLSGTFNLNSNLIDGSELAGEESTDDISTEETITDSIAQAPMEVMELPKNINFELNTDIKEILYDTYTIENFKGKVLLNEGVAKMNNVSMNMIEGILKMAGTYDSRDIQKPFFDFNFEMLGFQIDKMFETFNTVEKLAPIAKNCHGKINLKFKLNSFLNQNMEPILETMNGSGHFSSNNIGIGGSEAFAQLASLLKNDKYKDINLSNFSGDFTMENGDIIISPFELKMNNTKGFFGGRQGVDQSLDYVLNVNIPRSELGDANKIIDGLMDKGGALTKNVDLGETINVDIFITGTILKPHFSIGGKGSGKAVKEQVKEKINQALENGKEKAIAKAKAQADSLMAEANKQSEKLMTEANKQADEIRKNGQIAAKQVKDEADKQIENLMKQAKNPIAKAAAKKSSKKIKAEADKKASLIEKEANTKADQLVAESQKQSNNIKLKAKQEGNKLIDNAEKL